MIKSIQNSTHMTSYGPDPYNECHRICERKHDANIWIALCKTGCNINEKLGNYESNVPQPSEKLTASANNLLNESTKLLFMIDEMQAQDSMYL